MNEQRIGSHDHDRIKALLLGRTVKKVSDDTVTLDNGTIVRVDPNSGCGGCSAGWYELSDLNDVDNIITSVEIEEVNNTDPDNEWSDAYSYRVFVIAEDKRLKLLQVDGDDGNGYYGTGYELRVLA